ncbi:hypothetical protein [Virgibacillus halodenitrificans]|uniref:hypothetical protein n=1 Tax=Virgibacillus halodenitrificans TaxID=1482 RepID=UPI0003190BAE|nr:hypothetical protein [Virgibacillus halodenitrificans]
MKKLTILICLAFLLVMVGCSRKASEDPDYTTEEFESALNEGENLEGKTVSVKVDKLVPDSAFGYNIQAGEHLNFISSKNPDVKAGDEIIVKVEKVDSALGSYMISYKKQ